MRSDMIGDRVLSLLSAQRVMSDHIGDIDVLGHR
jgi:hypothetical protein